MPPITSNQILSGMLEKIYHADPCETPSLSSSMATTLINATEEEAMLNSRRLNPNYNEEDEKSSDAMDLGTIAHDFILRNGQAHKVYEIAPFKDFKSGDAKTVKANILSRGLIALNETTAEKTLSKVKDMRLALLKQTQEHDEWPMLMHKGKGELSAFAYDEKLGIWLRARLDWSDDDLRYQDVIVDYKTTSSTFDKWERDLWNDDKHLQEVHYRKVMSILTGKPFRFIWVVQRTVAPYQIRIIKIDESLREEVDETYLMASKRFANCLKTGKWRGQVPKTFHTYPPKYILDKWELRKLNLEIQEKEEADKAKAPAAQMPDDITIAG